jgi:DNA polymerase I
MKTFNTHDLAEDTPLTNPEALWVYNGLDTMVTLEVLNNITPQIDNVADNTYTLSRSLQAPILEMNMRGISVDVEQRSKVLHSYLADIQRLEAQLDTIINDGVGTSINWRSPKQLMDLLYNVFQLPSVKKRNSNGAWAPTVDREALEKLQYHFLASPIITHLLILRDLGKKVGVLKTEIDPDGRMRTSYNIAGTTTGRLSSSLSDFGSGTNLQNIEQRLRSVFVADPGMKLANIDLEQADSRSVGAICWNLFNDGTYLDACESGDLHTTVSRMAWKNMDWGDDPKGYRAIADRIFYRQFSFRDMAKKLGHGTNYLGTPLTMHKNTRIETKVIEEFQRRYFEGFPAIKRWHEYVAAQIRDKGQLTSLFGRRRHFFGRRHDSSTLREAVAYEPQSMTADILNYGTLNLWRSNICQILLQVHDSLTIQYPEEQEDTILPKVLNALTIPTELNNGRTFVVPCDIKCGWNWADQEKNAQGEVTGNVDGLKKWKGNDTRTRQGATTTKLLDRRVY